MDKTIKTLEQLKQEAAQQLQEVFDTLTAINRECLLQAKLAVKKQPSIEKDGLEAYRQHYEYLRKISNIQIPCKLVCQDLAQQLNRLKRTLT